eukprot:3305511-Rhodomonas_salina.1
MPFRVPAYLGSWYKFKPAVQVRKRRRAHGASGTHLRSTFAHEVASLRAAKSQSCKEKHELLGVYFGREENLHVPNAQNAQCKS